MEKAVTCPPGKEPAPPYVTIAVDFHLSREWRNEPGTVIVESALTRCRRGDPLWSPAATNNLGCPSPGAPNFVSSTDFLRAGTATRPTMIIYNQLNVKLAISRIQRLQSDVHQPGSLRIFRPEIAHRRKLLHWTAGMLPKDAPVWFRADNAYYKGTLVGECAKRGWDYSISLTNDRWRRPVLEQFGRSS